MAEGIEFSLKFQDQMSGVLKAVNTGGVQLNSTLNQMLHVLKSMDDEMRNAAGGAHELGAGAEHAGESMLGAVTGGELLAHGIERVTEMAVEGAKKLLDFGIEAIDNGFKAKVAFQAMAGGVEEGNMAFDEAERTARDLALPVKSVTDAFLSLKSAGVKDEWIRPLVAGAQDLATINPTTNLAGVSGMLENIALQGGLTSMSIRQLRSAGINLDLMAHQLGHGSLAEFKKSLEAKPMGLYESYKAITDTIKAQAHEGVLGSVGMRGAESFAGTIQRIKNEFESMFSAVDDGNAGPMADLRRAFTGVAELLDPMSDSGKQFMGIIGSMATGMGTFIKDVIDHKGEILNFFEGLGTVVSSIAKTIGFLGGTVESIAAAAGTVAGGGSLAQAREAFLNPNQEDLDKRARIGDQIAAFRAKSGGGEIPAYAGGGIVDEPTLALVGENGPEMITPLSGGGGGDFNAPINLTIHVDASGGGIIDEQRLAADLMATLPGALISPLERIAATRGAT